VRSCGCTARVAFAAFRDACRPSDALIEVCGTPHPSPVECISVTLRSSNGEENRLSRDS